MTDPDDPREPQPVDGATEASDETNDDGFERLLERLHGDHNFDFREYRTASLVRRIRARMQQVHADSFDGYAAYLERHPDEHVALFNTILINVTTFFRDAEAWKTLAEDVIPRLVDAAEPSQSVRLWSAGCSSGEEAYSAAMLLAEHLGDRAHDFNIKIYATDVDEEALHVGRHGLYRVEDLKEVPSTLLEKYFAREGQTYRFRRDVRRWCIFGRHNVAQDPPLSHIDLLLCRNVLIYFTSELQERILARFHYAVREGGFLFLGRSESLLARSRWFAPLHLKWRIFQRTTAPAPTVATALVRAPEDLVAQSAAPAVRDTVTVTSRLQRIIEALPAAVLMIDPMDTIVVWNATAEAMFDIPSESAIGHKFRDLDISYRIEGLRARIEAVKSSQIPTRVDHVAYMRRSGETLHVDLSIVPLVEGTRVVAVAVYGADITEAARVKEQMTRLSEQHATAIEELQSANEELETTNEELQSTNEELETTNEELQSTNEELETTVEELQATNAELAAVNTELERRSDELKRLDEYQNGVLSSLPYGIVVLDRDGIVTTWNQTAERLWGLRAEHVLRRPLWSLPLGDVGPKLRDTVTRVMESGAPEAVRDVPFTLPPGEIRRLSLQVTPLKTPSGDVIGAVGVVSLS